MSLSSIDNHKSLLDEGGVIRDWVNALGARGLDKQVCKSRQSSITSYSAYPDVGDLRDKLWVSKLAPGSRM